MSAENHKLHVGLDKKESFIPIYEHDYNLFIRSCIVNFQQYAFLLFPTFFTCNDETIQQKMVHDNFGDAIDFDVFQDDAKKYNISKETLAIN